MRTFSLFFDPNYSSRVICLSVAKYRHWDSYGIPRRIDCHPHAPPPLPLPAHFIKLYPKHCYFSTSFYCIYCYIMKEMLPFLLSCFTFYKAKRDWPNRSGVFFSLPSVGLHTPLGPRRCERGNKSVLSRFAHFGNSILLMCSSRKYPYSSPPPPPTEGFGFS